MKVVLFCGGSGMRLRGYADDVPKPMVTIGTRPILWHLMKYYAHFGHKDFILCLGYKGNVIKDYFLHYDESVSNDFVWSQGGKKIQFLSRDIDDWTITFVETGANATVAERLKAVESHLEGEEIFFANYGDGLSDLSLSDDAGFFSEEWFARGHASGATHGKLRHGSSRSRWHRSSDLPPEPVPTSGSTAASSFFGMSSSATFSRARTCCGSLLSG